MFWNLNCSADMLGCVPAYARIPSIIENDYAVADKILSSSNGAPGSCGPDHQIFVEEDDRRTYPGVGLMLASMCKASVVSFLPNARAGIDPVQRWQMARGGMVLRFSVLNQSIRTLGIVEPAYESSAKLVTLAIDRRQGSGCNQVGASSFAGPFYKPNNARLDVISFVGPESEPMPAGRAAWPAPETGSVYADCIKVATSSEWIDVRKQARATGMYSKQWF